MGQEGRGARELEALWVERLQRVDVCLGFPAASSSEGVFRGPVFTRQNMTEKDRSGNAKEGTPSLCVAKPVPLLSSCLPESKTGEHVHMFAGVCMSQ